MTLAEKIICHINYRDIFNAPVSKSMLKNWLGIEDLSETVHFNAIIDELKKKSSIVEKDGFLAVAGKSDIIELQKEKSAIAKRLIEKGKLGIRLLSMIPTLKFIGISGSVAAENPTSGIKADEVDLDFFIVTANNSLWFFSFFQRMHTSILRLFLKHQFYCLNFVTERSFLEIINKNFYTATELVNLKPLKGEDVYAELIKENEWYKKYYSPQSIRFCEQIIEISPDKKTSFVVKYMNYTFFYFYRILRAVKRNDYKGLGKQVPEYDESKRFNFTRICNPNGGYQDKIKEKFDKLLKINFEEYWSDELIDELFPSESLFGFSPSTNNGDKKIEELFQKYGA